MKSKTKICIHLIIVALLVILVLPFSAVQAAFLDGPQIVAGSLYTVGLRQDGTVVSTGDNSDGQRNIGDWAGITYLKAGTNHTVGVNAGGEVVAAGRNIEGQCNVSSWSDIVQVAAGYGHTVGLKSNGTAVAVGANKHGECNVGGWSNIIQIEADDYWSQGQRVSSHTIGLKADGTVVAVGANTHGQLDVSGWSDIVQVAAGGQHTVGLKSNGTVVAVGNNEYGKLNVSGWSDIVYIAAGDFHTIGVRSNGRVVGVGANYIGQINVGGWRGIIQVDAGRMHTVGVKADGTAVATGLNHHGQCNVSSWDLTSGYEQGYNTGYQNGYNAGYQEGNEDGYESGYQAALLAADIRAVNYTVGEPAPSYDGSIRESNIYIEFENNGLGDVFSAWAYVIDSADSITVTQPYTYIGDIPAGSSTWSETTITIRMDTLNPPAPGEGITFFMEYYDENYYDRYAEDIFLEIDFTLPVADASGPYSADEGEPLILDASASYDPGDDIVLYEWDLDDDGECDDAAGVTTTVVFDDDGVYSIGLRVTDDNGEQDTAGTSVTVLNLPPDVNTGADQSVNMGDTVSILAVFTDAGTLDTHTAAIHWGDGSSEAIVPTVLEGGSKVVLGSHEYAWPGTYEVSVEVTDDDGDTDSDVLLVRVEAVPELMVEILSDDVMAMGLPAGMVNSITASLESALNTLEDNNEKNDSSAINALKSFINEIEAQSGKKIAVEIADQLIEKAQEIIEVLNGEI